MSIIDPSNPGLFSFFAPKVGSPGTYQSMEARRRIALQLLANSKKGYPRTIGEGLTAIGDAIGDRAVLNQLAQQESAYQQQAAAAAEGGIPAEARTPGPQSAAPPAPAPAQTSALTGPPLQTPVAAAELTPDEQAAGVVGSEANALDAAAPAVASTGRRFAPAVEAAIERSAAANNLDPRAMRTIASLESSGDPNSNFNRATQYKGLFQMGTRGSGSEWARYGQGGNPFDASANADAAGRLMAANRDAFTKAMGRPPTPAELYLVHQQGLGHFTRGMVTNAVGNLPAGARTPENMTTQGFRNWWTDRYNREAAKFGSADQAPAASPRDQIAARLVGGTPAAQPLTTADAEASYRLGDVTGMGTGDRGYSYAPTASLGRTGDVMSDAPPITGISANVGAAAADTVQQARDAIARARTPTPPPPPAAAPAPDVVSDIPPAPPAAGAQLAQAALPPEIPKAPMTGLPARPVPPAPPVRMPVESDFPMGADEKRGYQMRARGAAMGDPNIVQQGQSLIDFGARQRQQQLESAVRAYQDQVAAPGRELERQQRELELAKGKAFGGIDQAVLFRPIEESSKAVAGLPGAQTSIRQARDLADNMFTGSAAPTQLALKKMLASAGFPVDPKISGTEDFQASIKRIMTGLRPALVGNANISDADIRLVEGAAGGDIRMEKKSITDILGALERLNVGAAIGHQRKLEAVAGDDPQRQSVLFGAFGLPMESIVPRQAIELLRSQPTPEVMEQFNKKYRTPGLAQRILGGG